MSIVHLLIIVVPSFAAGLIFGRSHLTGAYWGIAAEAFGLFMVALPISSGGGPRNSLSLATIAVSLALGAVAGALGFGALRLVKSRH
jgi:hypothetical protein